MLAGKCGLVDYSSSEASDEDSGAEHQGREGGATPLVKERVSGKQPEPSLEPEPSPAPVRLPSAFDTSGEQGSMAVQHQVPDSTVVFLLHSI